VTLKLEEKVFELIFTKLNWNSIFKENNDLINAIVKNFFDTMAASAMRLGQYIVMKAVLD
jgi:hypothetical protein